MCVLIETYFRAMKKNTKVFNENCTQNTRFIDDILVIMRKR
jgi:hypothetical protein